MATLCFAARLVCSVRSNEKNASSGAGVSSLLKSSSLVNQRLSINLENGGRRSRFFHLSAIPSSPGSAATSVTEDTTSLLDKVEVLDLDGKEIALTDLWKDRKTVVAFARHFGCVLCRKRADYLASVKDKMDKAGVALVLIGPGSVDQLKIWKLELDCGYRNLDKICDGHEANEKYVREDESRRPRKNPNPSHNLACEQYERAKS
ncbi:hypothetical protein Scep_004702 [Stephania cephalantha]|uniref:Alkyl hydroperoxide reductase subunit C/ Thiol specific antioxidant domain-containing protein n=1 Tax=Stephania cephalantha TaxID=152367 RepID=A0AAP0KSX5_9MAGN